MARFLQGVGKNGTTAAAVTFGSTLTASSYLLCYVYVLRSGNPAPTVSGVSDSGGNTYTQIATQAYGGNLANVYVFAAPNTHGATASNAVTATVVGTATLTVIGVMEYAEVNATPTDGINQTATDSTGTSYTGDSVTTTKANDVVIGLGYTTAAGTEVAGTNQITRVTSTAAISFTALDQCPAASGTFNPSSTTAGSKETALFTIALASSYVIVSNVHTQKASDTFIRADENPLTATNWTRGSGLGATSNLKIVSNQCLPTTSGVGGIEYWSTVNPWNADQYSQFTIQSLASTAGTSAMANVRLSSTTNTKYGGGIFSGGSGLGAGCTISIVKNPTGAAVTLVNKRMTISAGDIFRIDVIGTQLSLWVNGVLQLTAVDSVIAAGNAGLSLQAVTITHSQVTAWIGGYVTAPVAAGLPNFLMMMGVGT